MTDPTGGGSRPPGAPPGGREKPLRPSGSPRSPWDVTTPWDTPAGAGAPSADWATETAFPAPSAESPPEVPPEPSPSAGPRASEPSAEAPIEPPAPAEPAALSAEASLEAPVEPPPSLPPAETAGPSAPLAPPPVAPEPAPAAAEPAAPPSLPAPYPVRFDVAYPRRLSRWKTLVRPLLLIPLFFTFPLWWLAFLAFGLLLTVSEVLASIPLAASLVHSFAVCVALVGVWLAVFFTARYPAWLFAGVLGYAAWNMRIAAYATLLTDRFPSLDGAGSLVTAEADDPGRLARWRVLIWKSLLLVPHLIVLSIISIAIPVVVLLAWFGILITGNYPRGLFAFVTGFLRWYFRVAGYWLSFTDRFPPYGFSAGAGPASFTAVALSAVVGVLLGALSTAGIVAAVMARGDTDVVRADYDALVAGVPADRYDYVRISDDRRMLSISLDRVHDPGEGVISIDPGPGNRLVVFEWSIENLRAGGQRIGPGAARIYYESRGETGDARVELLLLDGRATRRVVEEGSTAVLQAGFIIPAEAIVTKVRIDPDIAPGAGIDYEFD